MSDNYQSQASVSVAFSEDGSELNILESQESHVSTSSAPQDRALADQPPLSSAIETAERELAYIEEQLARGSYNSTTGAFLPTVDGPERDQLEVKRNYLRNVVLPDTRALFDRQQAEKAQRAAEANAHEAAVTARAQQILAEESIEAEAQELAKLLKAARQ